jgi:predicted nucleic acid-binding protein
MGKARGGDPRAHPVPPGQGGTNNRPIGAMDQMIAAHAIALGLTLVTNNTRHFSRLEPGLTIENWAGRTDIA